MTPKLVRVAVFYVSLLVLWELLFRAQVWSPFLFPSPASVAESLVDNVRSGLIPEALGESMRRLGIGYALSFVLGMGLGVLTASTRWAEDTVGGVVLGLQSLPSITWLPLAVLWFGLSERAIIFVVLMGSTFSIAISAHAGIRALPPLLVRAAQTLGASRAAVAMASRAAGDAPGDGRRTEARMVVRVAVADGGRAALRLAGPGVPAQTSGATSTT